MPQVEIETTIKVCDSELLALQKLLSFQYHHQHEETELRMTKGECDLLNGIFFEINRGLETKIAG